MRTNINLIPVFCILLLCACKSGNASSQNSKEAPKDTPANIRKIWEQELVELEIELNNLTDEEEDNND